MAHKDRTEVKRTFNECWTKVGRKSNKCWMKRQDGKTVRMTSGRRMIGLERIVRWESDESRTDVEQTKVATMAMLSLVMLQQRWHYSSQRCCYYNVVVAATLLLRRCCCGVAVNAVRLLQRCCWSALRRCCCNSVMALRRCGWNFLFFFTRQFQERKWEREREKGARFETCFPTLLVGITPTPSCNNANSFQQQQHTHPPATVAIVAITTIIQ